MTIWRGALRRAIACAAAVLLLAGGMQGAWAANDDNPYTPSYATYDTTYDAILKMYVRVINLYGTGKSEGRHDLFNDGVYDHAFNGMGLAKLECENENERDRLLREFPSEVKKTTGYYIGDINGDGVDELVIGHVQNGMGVNEVFTMQDGRVRELMHAGYRCQGFVLKSGDLMEYLHGGAGMQLYSLYSFGESGPRRFTAGYYENEFYTFDGSPMGTWHGETWFRSLTGKEYRGSADTMVPNAEAQRWIADREAEIRTFNFIPLAWYERGVTSENAGIISVKGKTTGSSTVNIRQKPDKKAKLAVKVRVGTVVEILGEENGYYRVRVNGKEGFVQKDYVTVYAHTAGE